MDDLRYFKALKSAEKSKVNQMRSPDLKFSTKNRIFDLDRLRAFESKKFEAKVGETTGCESVTVTP